MLNLNKKGDILITIVEQYIEQNKKYLPSMLKNTYKPMFVTLRAFLFMTPEDKLKQYLARLKMLIEAIELNSSEEDFTEHLNELRQLWN